MECPNCTFQNMPGLKTCIRCHGLLDYSGLSVDPPRAASGRLLRRLRGARSRLGRGAGTIAAEAAAVLNTRVAEGVRPVDLVWCLVPGLPQLRRRHRIIGGTLLSAWLVVLMLAIPVAGSGLSIFLGLCAISIHSLSVSLAFNSALYAMPVLRRTVAGLAIYGVLLLGLYRPALYAAGSAVRILDVNNLRPKLPVVNHDVLLYSGRWTRPSGFRRGDLVVYGIARSRRGNVVVASGFGVERIIGLPGDDVESDGHTLWVNGVEQPEEMHPLGGLARYPFAAAAGENEYIIFPSALRWVTAGEYQQAQRQMMVSISHVHADDIRGRVFWRLRPWSRAGPPSEFTP